MKRKRPTGLIYELRQLFGFISPRRQKQVGLLVVFMLIASLSELISISAVMPFLGALSNPIETLENPNLRSIVAFFKISSPQELITYFSALFSIAIIAANCCRIISTRTQSQLAASISSDLSCDLFNKTLSQRYIFHLNHNSSDLISIVTEDTRLLTNCILIPFLMLISNSFIVIAIIGGLLIINWKVTIFSSLLLGGSYFLLFLLRGKLLKKNSETLVKNSQDQVKIVQEGLGGIQEILMTSVQSFFEKEFRKADIPYRQAIASNIIISLTPRYVFEMIAMLCIAALAVLSVRDNDLNNVIPSLAALALGVNRLLPVLQSEFVAMTRIQGARKSLQRILMGLSRRKMRTDLDPLRRLELKSEIRIEDVYFRYSDEYDWALHGVSLRIPAKSIIGIVGGTGSGKSTLADILMGLLIPQKGNIYYDQKIIEGDELKVWQSGLAYVPQNIFLRDATIYENIAFGLSYDEINFEKVKRAARLAKIDEFISSLSNGYNTIIGERGVKLSGGQRQRIGIARGLYREVSIIVFDEATSALDNSTEKEVMQAIESLHKEVTIILIAHRLTTVKNCDLIFELEKGKIIAQGTFDELISNSKSFRKQVSLNNSENL